MRADSDIVFRDPTEPGSSLIPREDWDRAPWNRWSFQNLREIVPTARVWRGEGPVCPLPASPRDIDDVAFEIDGHRDTIGRHIETSFADGFLVLHRGMVVAERYLNGMTDRTLHLSQSVSKSIVGTVAGILAERGELDVEALVTRYLPELEDTAYRGATVQHVLDMTSGVAFDETYSALDSHMAKLDVACGWKGGGDPSWPKTVWELILTLKEAECVHGTSFRYRSIETDVLAFILQRISGIALADLVARELWAPMGAQEDACFTVDPSGYALASGGFNATLRDYGRFALLHLGGGEINGRRIVPAGWIDNTRRGGGGPFAGVYREVLPHGAYHNQFWIEDPRRQTYMARGVFGQMIYLDPGAEFAAVVLSSWPEFLNVTRSRTTLAALHAIRDALA
ncbi:MAG TPA: 6-aminohexanoate hydrolase [Rhizobium sp.]|nr:6-aminohexanoate hydrolase [Rhizobium sp.]